MLLEIFKGYFYRAILQRYIDYLCKYFIRYHCEQYVSVYASM